MRCYPVAHALRRDCQQISAHPSERKASWMSVRLSQRTRRRRNWFSQKNVRSRTQRHRQGEAERGALENVHKLIHVGDERRLGMWARLTLTVGEKFDLLPVTPV
jgi:hypothetical protein